MANDSIIAGLGKTARMTEMKNDFFRVEKVLFYVPIWEDGSFNTLHSIMKADYFSSDGKKIGSAILNRHFFDRNSVRLSEIEVARVKYDIMENCSDDFERKSLDYEFLSNSSNSSMCLPEDEIYVLLQQTYRVFRQIVTGQKDYVSDVNPEKYEWLLRHNKFI